MSFFEIDPDIRNARTLASDFYTDPAYFQISKEKIFARTWQFVGTTDEVNNLKPVTILEGFLNEPALLVKSGDGIKCLSNVCTHRGKILIAEPCEAKLIRCGYHGRRFSLDGKFLSMPEFDGVEDFPSETDNLPQIHFANRGGFLFASVDPMSSFEAFVSEPAIKLEEIESDELKLIYLEGFHIPFVHHSLNEIVDYGTYKTETFRYSSLQTGLDGEGNVAGRYLFIFPNLMFNFYPWGISVNVVKPVAPNRSVVSFMTYAGDESKMSTGAGADLDRIELEDEAVVESVQKGIRSRFYSHGRYSPTREQGTHHFHRLICEFMR